MILFRKSSVIRVATGVVIVAAAMACGSDENTQTPEGAGTLSTVSPTNAFLGRTVDVFVTGVGTHFGGQPSVTFNDPGVRMVSVDVLSPTGLKAKINFGAEALAGPHDVVVTMKGLGDIPEERVTLPAAMVLTAPLKYETAAASVDGGASAGTGGTQGGIVDFVVTNLDKDNPFGGEAPRLTAGGFLLGLKEQTSTRIAGTALVDLLAPVGGLRLGITARSTTGELLTYAATPDDPMAPKIAAASPILTLAKGVTAGSEAIKAPRQTNLYKVTSPGDEHVFVLTMSTVGALLHTTDGPRLTGAMAPSNGRFEDGAPFDTTFDKLSGGRAAVGFLPKGGDAYIAIHTSDFSGGPTEYNYSVRAEVAKATPFAMAEPAERDRPDAPLATLDIAGPFFSTDGAIDEIDDADYVLITPAKDGRLFVSAVPIDSPSPINVTIFGQDPGTANCTAVLSNGLGTRQAEVRGTAGTAYCVRVSGNGSSSSLRAKYRLVITPEL